MTAVAGYGDALIEHFERPRNAVADAEAFVANPVRGDSMRIFLRIEGGRVARAVPRLRLPDRDRRLAAGGGELPKSKLHCSVLATAVREAIGRWRNARPADGGAVPASRLYNNVPGTASCSSQGRC